MPKLTEKDIALLKSRNPNFKGFKTTIDFEIPKSTPKAKKSKKTSKVDYYVNLFSEAMKAGEDALKACKPHPMIVSEHENMLDDNSPVKQAWFISEGACGFAWVNIKYKGEGAKFINAMKKAGLAGGINSWATLRKDDYYGGYTYWVGEGGQSIERKEAYAYAMVEKLREAGITAYANSRLD